MAYDGAVWYDGTEIINLSRTTQLAEALGIDSVWIDPDDVAWIQGTDVNYDVVTTAPWYRANIPASGEFAGVLPLSLAGLDDSSRETNVREYITDGGNPGRGRHTSLSIVGSAVLVASTDRGARYGKRWLDRILASSAGCSGVRMAYFAHEPTPFGELPEIVFRREVAVSRASTVTRKRITDCSATWTINFTLTCGDPYEYTVEQFERATGVGASVATGADIIEQGTIALTEQACPSFSYAPVYDPEYPALVTPPTPPNLIPDGWGFVEGSTFTRYWARVSEVAPGRDKVVPVITLTSDIEARSVRVGVWPGNAAPDELCNPLFSAALTYLPSGAEGITLDGSTRAAYVQLPGGFVRRAESLVYGPNASPVEWTSFSDEGGLLLTLDVFSGSDDGGGTVRADFSLVERSD